MKTVMAWIGAVLLFGLLMTNASAFPLSGGNGQVNATVFGTYQTDKEYAGMRFTLVDLSSTGALSDVVLVDSEDKFHEPDFGTEGVDSVGALGRSSRNIWPFDLPDKVDIKRIRVTPTLGDPFSIDWTGVPEVISSKITFKFYGIARVPSISGRYDELDALDADIKITNNGKNTTVIDSGKFVIIDQFDFPYASSTTDSVKLLPGESMRVSIKFESVSMLSRPVFLIYRPENLSMDISAWA